MSRISEWRADRRWQKKWAVDEEWWRWHNLRRILARLFVCSWRGHDYLVKFSGTRLCNRCH